MTDKIQKIRKKVERLKSNLIHGACSSQIAMETRCKEEAYNEVLAILDTMQENPVCAFSTNRYSDDDRKVLCDGCEEECKYVIDFNEEPVSEDFEATLAKEWQGYVDRGAATVDALEDNTQELAFAKGFYRGANWQKDQMTKTAIDGKIYETQARSKLKAATIGKISGLKYRVGDKVKLIILKED